MAKLVSRHENEDGSVVGVFEEDNGSETIAHSLPDRERVTNPPDRITRLNAKEMSNKLSRP